MITAAPTDNIIESNIKNSQVFKIYSSPKAFDILSDKLYTDKIKAVVREISCNAYDAHVSVGKGEIPFEVHIPNNLEPYFSVRDFGPGISEQDIFEVYTTYFESTKSESNDYVGCLGLGCKSPFSYTSSFNVHSFQNGIVKIYAMFKDNSRPNVSKIFEGSTTEPDGLYVKIAASNLDIHKFITAAQLVYNYFKTVPIITGNNVTIDKDNIKAQFDWGYTEKIVREYSPRALMGNVSYCLNDFPLSYSINKTAYQYILNMYPIIYFNIGEIDVTASREKISYDPATVKAIEDKLEYIFKSIISKYENKYRDCNTFIDAIRVADEICSSFNYEVAEIIHNKCKPLYEYILDIVWDTDIICKYYHYHKKTVHASTCKIREFYGKDIIRSIFTKYNNTHKFYYMGKTRNKINSLKNDIRNNKNSGAWIFEYKKELDDNGKEIKKDHKEIPAYIHNMFNNEILSTDTLPTFINKTAKKDIIVDNINEPKFKKYIKKLSVISENTCKFIDPDKIDSRFIFYVESNSVNKNCVNILNTTMIYENFIKLLQDLFRVGILPKSIQDSIYIITKSKYITANMISLGKFIEHRTKKSIKAKKDIEIVDNDVYNYINKFNITCKNFEELMENNNITNYADEKYYNIRKKYDIDKYKLIKTCYNYKQVLPGIGIKSTEIQNQAEKDLCNLDKINPILGLYSIFDKHIYSLCGKNEAYKILIDTIKYLTKEKS